MSTLGSYVAGMNLPSHLLVSSSLSSSSFSSLAQAITCDMRFRDILLLFWKVKLNTPTLLLHHRGGVLSYLPKWGDVTKLDCWPPSYWQIISAMDAVESEIAITEGKPGCPLGLRSPGLPQPGYYRSWSNLSVNIEVSVEPLGLIGLFANGFLGLHSLLLLHLSHHGYYRSLGKFIVRICVFPMLANCTWHYMSFISSLSRAASAICFR